jgi:hypothetical protein
VKETQRNSLLPATPRNTVMANISNLRPPWQPGESGNPNGRPARTRLTEAFVADFADSWGKHGPRVLDELARKQPQAYTALAVKMVPQNVIVDLQARSGALDEADLAILRAIKAGIPDANSREPGEVMNYVLEAIRAHSGRVIEHDTPTTHDTKPLNDKD